MRTRANIYYGLLLLVALLLPGIAVHAQYDYDMLRKKYASESAVFTSRKENVVIKIEKDVPVIYSNVSEELFLLTDKTRSYMDRDVYWSDFSEIHDLDARSLIPDG